MSETKHSPEPWKLSHEDIRDAEGRTVLVLSDLWCPVVDADEHADDLARRIVACVNACAGIPTAALESGALGKALDACAKAMTPPNLLPWPWAAALRALGRLK